MSSKTTAKKNTGLGASAFFPAEEDSTQSSPVAKALSKPVPDKPVRAKTRTTVILYNDTLESIELLKAQSRKKGVKASMSDILNDAVALLMQERQQQTS